MIGWMRLVLPRGWVLGLFAFAYLLLEGLRLSLGTRHPLFELLALLRNELVLTACWCYGVYRVISFHPVFRTAYRRWLEVTPWTSRLPLPAGPIHLVWQDLVLLLVAEVLLQRYVGRLWIEPLRAFLTGYLMCCLIALSGTSQRVIAYAMAFGLGLVALLCSTPFGFYPVLDASLVAELALYGLAYTGIQRSLATFPWEQAFWEKAKTGLAGNQPIYGEAASETMLVGWPFNRLQPQQTKWAVRYSDGILVSLLTGWWLYAIGSLVESEADREALLEHLYVAIIGAAVIGRFLVYRAGHAPPIGFWGRVFTLRWIIPRHDQMFLAPVCAVLAAFFAPPRLEGLGLPTDVAIPLSLALSLIVAINMGPCLARWRLTAVCRLSPGLQSSVYSKL